MEPTKKITYGDVTAAAVGIKERYDAVLAKQAIRLFSQHRMIDIPEAVWPAAAKVFSDMLAVEPHSYQAAAKVLLEAYKAAGRPPEMWLEREAGVLPGEAPKFAPSAAPTLPCPGATPTPNDIIAMLLDVAGKAQALIANGGDPTLDSYLVTAHRQNYTDLADALGSLEAIPYPPGAAAPNAVARAERALESFTPYAHITHAKIGPITEAGMAALCELMDKAGASELVPGMKIVMPHQTESAAHMEIIDWAVDKWISDVRDRPMLNVHRRTLDGCYRAIIKHVGGDDVKLLGPDHDSLMMKSSHDADQMDNEAAEKAFWSFDARVKGYNDWQGQPQDQRMAFKAEFLRALRTPFFERERLGREVKNDWATCERIESTPSVEEAFRDFSNNSSQDNAIEVVSAVLKAAGVGATDIPAQVLGVSTHVVGQVFEVRNYDDKFVEDLLVSVADISSDGRRFRACVNLFALLNGGDCDEHHSDEVIENVVCEVMGFAPGDQQKRMPTLDETRRIVDLLVERGIIADDTAPENNVNLYATWEVMRQDALGIARQIVEQYREPVAAQRVICKHCCAVMPDDEKDTLSEQHAGDCVVNKARQFIEDTDV
jgi:hypothetical protein